MSALGTQDVWQLVYICGSRSSNRDTARGCRLPSSVHAHTHIHLATQTHLHFRPNAQVLITRSERLKRARLSTKHVCVFCADVWLDSLLSGRQKTMLAALPLLPTLSLYDVSYSESALICCRGGGWPCPFMNRRGCGVQTKTSAQAHAHEHTGLKQT